MNESDHHKIYREAREDLFGDEKVTSSRPASSLHLSEIRGGGNFYLR